LENEIFCPDCDCRIREAIIDYLPGIDDKEYVICKSCYLEHEFLELLGLQSGESIKSYRLAKK
jgi:hypothetical protein